MAKFATAPVEEVAPKRKERLPSNRSLMQAQYQQALRESIEQQQALVVELEDRDKPLTIRDRLARAAQVLGFDRVVVRRRGTRIIAYRSEEKKLREIESAL